MSEALIAARRRSLSDPNIPYDVIRDILGGITNSLEIAYIRLANKSETNDQKKRFHSELDRVQEISRNYDHTREELVEHIITLEEELKMVRGDQQ